MPIYGTTPDATSGTKGKIQLAGSLAGTAGTPVVAAGAITNAMLTTTAGELGGAFLAYTPTWVNLTVGNGTNTGKYVQVGKIVFFWIELTFGSTSAISGAVTASLPVTAATLLTTHIIAWGTLDDATGSTYQSSVRQASTTTAAINAINASATNATTGALSSTNPFTWTTSDTISVHGWYEAA